MNKYIAYYEREKMEFEAGSLWAAKQKAVDMAKAKYPRRSERTIAPMVSVMLAEVDGREVVHDPGELP